MTPRGAERLVACLLLTVACGNDSSTIENQLLTRSTVLVPFGPEYPMPGALAVSGNSLWAASGDDLSAFDRESGRRTATAGRPGDGPREFRWISSFQAYQDEQGRPSIWAYDRRHGRLTGFFLTADGTRILSDSMISALTPEYHMAYHANDTTIVAFRLFDEHRFDIVGQDGEVRRSVGELPHASEEAPVTVRSMMFEPVVTVRPKGDKIAIGSRHAGMVEIYTLMDGERTLANVPIPFPPVVNMRWNGAIHVYQYSGATLFGYIAIASTNDRIFALFSGRTMAGCNQCAWFGNRVHVFDWDGALQEVITLDADAHALAVAIDGSALFTAAVDPESIRHYHLGVGNEIVYRRNP